MNDRKKRYQQQCYFNRLFTFFAIIMALIINYNHCLCCGSAAISKVFTCKDYTVSQEQFDVYKCSTCTFRFTQNVPAANYIGSYYQSDQYVSHSDTKEGFINKAYHFIRNYTLKSKRNLVKKTAGADRGVLLDIGAGTGAFAHTMEQAGWKVTGLEPDDIARKKALDNYGLTLLELSHLDQTNADTFDAITLWHVLEHVHDLHRYLEKFMQVLKLSGRLIVAVPNYTCYDSFIYKECWAAYDVPRHLYHFSPKSMQILLEQKGFELEECKPMWFDSFYVSMLSEKYKFGKNKFIRAFWIGLVSNMKAFYDPKKCSSVIYIIRKK
ncbi:MAG: class I SAM-dependent methyltransferase [Bacteroidota bacterium]|nr:class I SAM-dependent methyltransferase [Bacteroidota bacterium]